ncbi:Rpn family recombination-promoting nuclease/putative transposase [Deferribacterales bacterium RsTz2092]|nr:hypothetical protein AGMMS49941_10370 [Deferribacterales bacterium]
MSDANANREYKDSVFTKLFSDKDRLVELYNAIVGANIVTADDIEINTLENILFMNRRNDLSFVIGKDKLVVLVEHQSTINHNMPLRFLEYISRVYEKMIDNEMLYRTTMLTVPRPEFIVLYNGNDSMPDEKTMKLSDMFSKAALRVDSDRQGFLELSVRVLNVNNGYNKAILGSSRTLGEYAGFVETAKRHIKGVDYRDKAAVVVAMRAAIKECVENNILREFLVENSKEVINMLTTEFNLETAQKVWYREGMEIGEQRGLQIGEQRGLQIGEQRGLQVGQQRLSQEVLSFLDNGDLDTLRKRLLANVSSHKSEDAIN